MPTVTGMNALLPQIKVLADVTKDTQSTYLRDLLNDKKLNDPSEYSIDYLDNLHKLIESGFSILYKSNASKLKEEIEKYRSDKIRKPELVSSLVKTLKILGRSLKTNSRETLSLNTDYRLIAQTILQLTDVDLNIGDFSKKLSKENMVRTTSRIADKAMQLLDSKVKYTEQKINKDFKDFQRLHGTLVKKLMEYHGKGGLGRVTDSDMSAIFENLYKVKPKDRSTDVDKNNLDILYTLKDANDKTLAPIEKEYIEFFNSWILKGFEKTLSPKEFKAVEDNTNWKLGQIPLIFASTTNQIAKEDDFKKKIKIAINSNLDKNIKNTQETFDAINTRIDNQYEKQLGPGIQNGRDRLRMLGLDPEGNPTDTGSDIETNLEAVLNKFFADSLRVAHYEETLGIYNAINTVAFIEENEHFNKTEDIRKFMEGYTKLIVFGEYNKEGKGAQFIDTGQKGMTFAALGFSGKQVVLEGATNLFGSIAAVIQQAMMGKEKRFNVKEYSEAGAMVIGDRAKGYTNKDMTRSEAIAREFGIFKADSESQAAKEQQESRKNGWFQSKWAYHLNNMPFMFFKTQTFMAELIHKGIMPALTVDKDGQLIYDYRKDKRFSGIFDEKGDVRDNIQDADLVKKRALYDSIVKDLAEEGYLDGKGKPTRPLSIKEVIAMKDYSLSLYGSIDKDAKVVAQAYTWGRMFLKFKNWAVAKKDNYWTPTHQSEIRGERTWVEDAEHPDGGYYQWQAQNMEGILQTIFHMGRGLSDMYRGKDTNWKNFKKLYTGLNRNQKENLTKLTADILMVTILTVLLSALFDDEYFKKGEGKLMSQAIMNATSDLNVVRMMDSMADGNPIAVLSYAFRSVDALYTGVGHMVTGDFEKGSKNIMSITGVGKSVYSFFE
jgi:hypothetical protein